MSQQYTKRLILIGRTPPPAKYYSYQTFLSEISEFPGRAGYPVGDTVNSGTIRTIGSDKFNKPIVYIIVANQETERRIKEAVVKAGYPEEIINIETISPHITQLGITDNLSVGTWFAFAHRVAVPENQTELEQYVRTPPYQVFRITPKEPIASDPEPVPTLRVKGTGKTEMDLYPSLKKLREAILKKYSTDSNNSGSYKELDTHIWNLTTRRDNREMILDKPYVGVQRQYQVIGATRDTNYLATYPNIMLRNGTDEFAIIYGVNHEKAGKVTYSSVSIYADKDRWFGLKNGTMFNFESECSAERYLPDDPNAQYLYAIKVARDCGDEDYCLEAVQPDFTDINGTVYPCILGDYLTGADPHAWDINENEIFFIFRSYMEPSTNVAPDDNELLYDQAIYFGPYFSST